jgi:hypothetical protein
MNLLAEEGEGQKKEKQIHSILDNNMQWVAWAISKNEE